MKKGDNESYLMFNKWQRLMRMSIARTEAFLHQGVHLLLVLLSNNMHPVNILCSWYS